MKPPRKLLIMDDDPHYAVMFALKLQQRFPELDISSSNHSTLLSGYDIYVLDNDFGGDKHGAELAEKVRADSPESLVLVLSGTLEMELLKRLVNCHAAGVFDKSKPGDLEQLMQLTEAFLLQTPAAPPASAANLAETVSGISKLISEWNQRLSFEEKR
ncbi:MAG: response regulator transcription factor [Kordiimonadaceae bacterium]|nr:response regulator transcription factor [Kordiimonadaceae bacterium]